MNNYVLVFVANADMVSMTPGRVAAQAMHGQSVADHYLLKDDRFDKWRSEENFGTVWVMKNRNGCPYETVKDKILNKYRVLRSEHTIQGKWKIDNNKIDEADWIVNIHEVIDPEYHLKDGDKVVHKVPDVETGFVLFGLDVIIKEILVPEIVMYDGYTNSVPKTEEPNWVLKNYDQVQYVVDEMWDAAKAGV